ncbi:hypothetical protein N9Y42_00025 [Mariniblastus sp.]|nr:hypothetical protein [Mariniblastus sp.]
MVFVGIVTMATPLVVHLWTRDIWAMPPQAILERLDDRFENLNSSMDFDDAFIAFGLERYHTFLTDGYAEMHSGGIGGMRSSYNLGTDGYSLEMVTYRDGTTACILRTPNNATSREAELASVDPMF